MLISTEYDSSQCFVLTSSLDGEKNLKPKLALKSVQDNLNVLMKDSERSLLEINVPTPDKNLYNFNGLVKYGLALEQPRTYDIELRQFLHSVRIDSIICLGLYFEKFWISYRHGDLLRQRNENIIEPGKVFLQNICP
jgi:hypothetical protein